MIAYHYCGADAFRWILSTKTLWATHFNYLNDAGEILRGIEIAQDEVASLRSAASTGRDRLYFDQVSKRLTEKASRQIFVVCFSAVGDLLSQWRAYADDGRGFAIGFNLEQLTTRPSPTGQKMNDTVVYNEDQLRSVIHDFLLVNAPSAQSDSDPDENLFIHANADNHSWGILRTAVFFKHHGFAEERETRIAFVCHLPNGWDSIRPIPLSEMREPLILSSHHRIDKELPSCRKFRVGPRGFVPYLEWKFEASDIAEIRVGPRAHTEPQLTALRMFLESNGYTHLVDKVISSNATYR